MFRRKSEVIGSTNGLISGAMVLDRAINGTVPEAIIGIYNKYSLGCELS